MPAASWPLNQPGSVILAGDTGSSGTRTSPPAPFSLIFTGQVLPAGTYTVTWTVTLSGTIAAAEANNFILNLGPSIFLADSVNAAAAGSYPQAKVTFTTPGGLSLLLLSGAAGATSGAVYGGSESTDGFGIVQLTPDGQSEHWHIDTASVKATQPVTNEAAARIYCGPQVADQYFADGTLSGSTGDSTDRLAGYDVTRAGPFPSVWAVWTGGDVGAIATLILAGTRSYQ